MVATNHFLLIHILLFISTFNNVSCHEVKNLRQLTFGQFTTLYPRFSPDEKRISYTGCKQNSCQVYEINVDEPFPKPRRVSSGIGSAHAVGYVNNTHTIQAVNLFSYPNLTVAFENTIERDSGSGGNKFEAVLVNQYGNFERRFANFSADGKEFFFGYKNGYVLGRDGPYVTITNISNGNQTRISVGKHTDLVGAVFHRTEDLVFYNMITADGSRIYASDYSGNHKKLIYKADPGSKVVVYDICDEGKHLFVNRYNTSYSVASLESGTISVKTGKFEPILLANNTLKGVFLALSSSGKYLAFNGVSKEQFPRLFIVDWENDKKHNEAKRKQQRTEKFDQKRVDRGHSHAKLFDGEEKHLKDIKQVTFGGQNAEGYFAFEHDSFVFQAAGMEDYGTSCDQIYRTDFDRNKVPKKSNFWPKRLSTGLGSCTCSYLFPDDKTAIYASTFLNANLSNINDAKYGTCEVKKCQSGQAKTDPVLRNLCNTSYTWDLHSSYDIFKVDEVGNFLERLTDSPGYDAEGAISPDGKRMVFTSVRSGDPELWLYNFEDNSTRQLTDKLGYDGGPFFSPDGTKVGFRASRPTTDEEIAKYKLLLSYDLVEPLEMDLYTVDLKSGAIRQVTNVGNSSWAPFYLNDNRRIVFSSNFNEKRFGTFNLYVVNDDGSGLQQVTYSNGFDAFPMMSRDGGLLIWGSSRNGKSMQDLNLFIAEWVD